jgi:hypothetical protein
MAKQACKCGRGLVRIANAICTRCWREKVKTAPVWASFKQLDLFEDH